MVVSLLTAANSYFSTAHAQGTAFTYQGRLNSGGAPANGLYDLRFRLFLDSFGNNQAGGTVLDSAVPATNGLFLATVDFGPGIFTGTNYWLEVDVRTNGASAYTDLSPLQEVTPAPYAVFANTASNLSGTLPAAQLGGMVPSANFTGTYSNAVTLNNSGNSFSGNFSGSGVNMSNVNAVTLNGFNGSSFWQTGGNSGTTAGVNYLGTPDNQPLELHVMGERGLRLEPSLSQGAPNVIGGSFVNFIAPGAEGSFIGGGGTTNFSGIGTFLSNSISDSWGVIGGGVQNTIQSGAGFATIAGGFFNMIDANDAVIGGGYSNTNHGTSATVGGGQGNTAGGGDATVSGGNGNTAGGDNSTIPGGYGNTANGEASFAAGGDAHADFEGCFVWADELNGGDVPFSATGINQFLIRASGGVGIGMSAPAAALHVASTNSTPEFQITQLNPSDYTRLRMNVTGNVGWEMDVSPGSTPQLQFFYVGAAGPRLTIDTAGDVTTAGTVNGTSDRNAKEKFTEVSSRDVLDKVLALPITEWNFKQEPDVRHIGPMAQDFYAAFQVGMDDKHIAMVDEEGVALAAIQGLNEKLTEKDAEIQDLKQTVAELKKMMSALAEEKGR